MILATHPSSLMTLVRVGFLPGGVDGAFASCGLEDPSTMDK